VSARWRRTAPSAVRGHPHLGLLLPTAVPVRAVELYLEHILSLANAQKSVQRDGRVGSFLGRWRETRRFARMCSRAAQEMSLRRGWQYGGNPPNLEVGRLRRQSLLRPQLHHQISRWRTHQIDAQNQASGKKDRQTKRTSPSQIAAMETTHVDQRRISGYHRSVEATTQERQTQQNVRRRRRFAAAPQNQSP